MSDDELIRRGDAIAAMQAKAAANALGPCGGAYLNAVHALRTIPAVQVTVKPGEIERAVWSAMSWAADYDSGSNGAPEYTDCGNSFAEIECRRAAARVRSALTIAPAPDAVKVAALVEAACGLLDAYSAIVGPGNPWGDSLRAALRAMIQPDQVAALEAVKAEAVRAEREACAQVAEYHANRNGVAADVARDLTIRARGGT